MGAATRSLQNAFGGTADTAFCGANVCFSAQHSDVFLITSCVRK
jgi:hypothetical protein